MTLVFISHSAALSFLLSHNYGTTRGAETKTPDSVGRYYSTKGLWVYEERVPKKGANCSTQQALSHLADLVGHCLTWHQSKQKVKIHLMDFMSQTYTSLISDNIQLDPF